MSKDVRKLERYLQFQNAILSQVHDAIIAIGNDNKITYWNKGAEQLYQYTAREALGKNLSDINKFRWSTPAIVGSWHGEVIHVKKSGEEIYVDALANVIFDEKGKKIGLLAVVRDINEQKRTEYTMKFLIEASNILASSLDYEQTLTSVTRLVVPKIADWCSIDILDENGTLQLLSVAHKDPKKIRWAIQLREQNPIDMNSPTGAPRVIRTGKAELYADIPDELLVTTAKDEKELKLIRDIGMSSVMIIPLIARGKTLGVITFVATIESNKHFNTDDLLLAEDLARRAAIAVDNARLYKLAQEEIEVRKKKDTALRESEMRFKRLFDSNIIGITVWKFNGEVIEINDALLKMLQISRKETPNRKINWIKLTPPEYETADAKAFEELKKTGECIPFEKELIRKDGSRIPVMVGAAMLANQQDTGIAYILDISDRKELEKRKDDFISMASHELKTPVTSIKVFTQLLQKQFAQKNDMQSISYLSRMNGQIDKLTILISDLLDLSKIQAGQLSFHEELFDINTIVRELIELNQSTMKKHTIILEGKISKKFYGDPDRIGQVIINLLSNAIKYSPQSEKIVVRLSQNAKNIHISFEDFGIGIAQENKEKIFDRFYRVDEKTEKTFPGLGIGLYISSQIIKRHGGKIWVEGKEGKGSIFHVSLPLKNSTKTAAYDNIMQLV